LLIVMMQSFLASRSGCANGNLHTS
jgi:hypothetical protein